MLLKEGADLARKDLRTPEEEIVAAGELEEPSVAQRRDHQLPNVRGYRGVPTG